MESSFLYLLFGSLVGSKKKALKAKTLKEKIIEETESYKKDIEELRTLTNLTKQNRQSSNKYL